MATPSFRSVWLLTCVAAFSTALHLNQNSIPRFHRSSRVSSHILCCCYAKAECLLVDLCDRLFFRGIRGVWDPHPSNSTAGVSQAHWEGSRDQARLAETGPAGGTKEWSPSCLLPAFLPERLWLPPQCQALEQARCAQRPSAVGPDSVPSDLLFPSMADAVMVSSAEYKA